MDGESLSPVSGAARQAWEHAPEKTRSAEECREAAENGDPDAQYWLGVRYRDGIGVSQNYREAWTWLRTLSVIIVIYGLLVKLCLLVIIK